MTENKEPNDNDYEISRKLRSLNRRVERLEDTGEDVKKKLTISKIN